MEPKLTIKDAAKFLNISSKNLIKQIYANDLPFHRVKGTTYLGFEATHKLFTHDIVSQAICFQIVKGGTGKTSLATSFAIRANLYGLKVLCIDLDQQGNMTQSFGVDAEVMPIMVDILASNYSFNSAIKQVMPGLDLIASRIENAALDDVIKLKKYKLDKVFSVAISSLKQKYDLIVIDCPPNLGHAVAAMTLAADRVIAPVVPENFSLTGLKATSNAMIDLKAEYKKLTKLSIVLNKFVHRSALAQDTYSVLTSHPVYSKMLLNSIIHLSNDVPESIAKRESIFDSVKSSDIQSDIDAFTIEVLNLCRRQNINKNYSGTVQETLEESLA